jgi:multiple sugar transport system permease protein
MRAPGLPAARTSAGAALRRAASLLLVHAFLLAGAAFVLLPFVWMLVTSIKPPAEVFNAVLSFWPKRFYGVENYAFALSNAPLLRFALNGVILCGGILIVQLLVAIPCAYALAKLRFPGRNLLFALVLLGLVLGHRRLREAPAFLWSIPVLLVLPAIGLWGLSRYRAPVDPFLVMVAAVGIVALVERRRVSP